CRTALSPSRSAHRYTNSPSTFTRGSGESEVRDWRMTFPLPHSKAGGPPPRCPRSSERALLCTESLLSGKLTVCQQLAGVGRGRSEAGRAGIRPAPPALPGSNQKKTQGKSRTTPLPASRGAEARAASAPETPEG